MRFTNRTRFPPSATVALAERVRALQRAGKEIIRLETGDHDFPTEQAIVAAAYASAAAGETHYAPSRGDPRLLAALSEKLRNENGMDVHEDEVLITPGGKQGIFYALSALLQEGDEAILLEPLWNTFSAIVTYFGATPVPVASSGFRFDAQALRQAITQKTRLIIVNYPNNPTGITLDVNNLRDIATIAEEKKIMVLADECYEDILYEGKHISLGSLPGMKQRVVSCFSFSKTYAMTGWRVGYIVGPKELVDEMNKLQQQTATCVPQFVMDGAREALKHREGVAKRLQTLRERRDLFVGGLNSMQGIHCPLPAGTFYAFPDFSAIDKDSRSMAERLLTSAGVAAVPGTAFGASGEGHLRMSFAFEEKILREALKRIRRAIE